MFIRFLTECVIETKREYPDGFGGEPYYEYIKRKFKAFEVVEAIEIKKYLPGNKDAVRVNKGKWRKKDEHKLLSQIFLIEKPEDSHIRYDVLVDVPGNVYEVVDSPTAC